MLLNPNLENLREVIKWADTSPAVNDHIVKDHYFKIMRRVSPTSSEDAAGSVISRHTNDYRANRRAQSMLERLPSIVPEPKTFDSPIPHKSLVQEKRLSLPTCANI